MRRVPHATSFMIIFSRSDSHLEARSFNKKNGNKEKASKICILWEKCKISIHFFFYHNQPLLGRLKTRGCSFPPETLLFRKKKQNKKKTYILGFGPSQMAKIVEFDTINYRRAIKSKADLDFKFKTALAELTKVQQVLPM